MSFSQNYHPRPTGSAPVRVECLITPGQTDGTYDFVWQITVRDPKNPSGTVSTGAKGSVSAGDSDSAEAQVYGKLIDELAIWLAEEVTRAD